MAYWLMKTEPEEFSGTIRSNVAPKGEPWSGVRNFHGAETSQGDEKKARSFSSTTPVTRSRLVGYCEVLARRLSGIPTAKKDEPWVAVTTGAVEPLPKPVTLATIKAEPKLKDMVL